MADETYNGWTNYETWAVGMYLDGNYTGGGTYCSVLESVQRIVYVNTTEAESDQSAIRWRVAEYLKELTTNHAEAMLRSGASLAADLLGAALSSVSWIELADAKIQEVGETS